VVLWLRDYGIDIGCIELTARSVDGTSAVLSARQLLPLPEAEDYLVRRRRKEQQEEKVRRDVGEWTWERYQATFPTEQVAVARTLFDQMEPYAQQHELPWEAALRSWYLGVQRPGRYWVAVVDLHRQRPVNVSIKIPDDPAKLGLDSPFPELKSWWDAANRQWRWEVPSREVVPELARALDIAARFQPATGPMPQPT
jgi:hypothetical protein